MNKFDLLSIHKSTRLNERTNIVNGKNRQRTNSTWNRFLEIVYNAMEQKTSGRRGKQRNRLVESKFSSRMSLCGIN
ncbi:uncharacterized protein LOC143154993 [Ptiloglossa arizonensis]|uniref:uncharacterized protein LOC143154993 n=1 Tax=Ptiloglossa arizonensis TaxID=3350558 RepID=UPI003F9F12EE